MYQPRIQRLWLAWLKLYSIQSGKLELDAWWVKRVRDKMIQISDEISTLELV